jgi:hypothetical protein
VPIERLRSGDFVQAYSFERASVVTSVVTDTIEHDAQPVMRVRSTSGTTLHVTPNHPIYVVDSARFEPAGEITSGANLLALTSLTTAAAIPVELSHGEGGEVTTVYDLTVDQQHNYFAAGILVHNKERCWTNADGCNVCVGEPYQTCPPQKPGPMTAPTAPLPGSQPTNARDAGADSGASSDADGGSAGAEPARSDLFNPTTFAGMHLEDIRYDCTETAQCLNQRGQSLPADFVDTCMQQEAQLFAKTPETQARFLSTLERCKAFQGCDYYQCTQTSPTG